jgi:hypothetical protein
MPTEFVVNAWFAVGAEIDTVGATVSATLTLNVRETGVAVLPATSAALTVNVYEPLVRLVNVFAPFGQAAEADGVGPVSAQVVAALFTPEAVTPA